MQAAYYLARSDAGGEHGTLVKPLDRFRQVYFRHATGPVIHTTVEILAESTADPARRTSALRALASIIDLVPRDLLPRVLEAVYQALEQGWHWNSSRNAVDPACRLLEKRSGEIEGDEAARVREALVALIGRTPLRGLELLYETLAPFLYTSPLPADEGAALAARLVEQFRAAKDTHFQEAVLVCLAALSERASGEVREQLQSAIAGWNGDPWVRRFWLQRAGINPSSDEANELVRSLQAALVRQLREAEQGNSLSMMMPYRGRLYRAFLPFADAALCEETLGLTLRFLEEPRHLLDARRLYLEVAAYLAEATASPETREDAVRVFARIAQVGLPMGHGVDRQGAHPLAALRIGGRSEAEDRAGALSALALLHGGSEPHEQREIEEVLLQAGRDPEAAVRAEAARLIGMVLAGGVENGSELVVPLSATWVSLIDDRSTEVRVDAIVAFGEHAEAFLHASIDQAAAFATLSAVARDPGAPIAVVHAAQEATRRLRPFLSEAD